MACCVLSHIFFDARLSPEAISTFVKTPASPVVELNLVAIHAAIGNQAHSAISSAIRVDPHASIAKNTNIDVAPPRAKRTGNTQD
jgi:hypothetical protein